MRPVPRSLLAVALVTGASLWLGSCTKAPADAITKDNAFWFYRGYERITRQPRSVQTELFESCIGPTPELAELLKKRRGPHADGAMLVYANTPVAARRIGSNAFAVGTVIVKEKLGPENVIVGVGGMRKREPGYDPRHGDWEYFYATGHGDFAIGRLSNCVGCHHANARESDHVFLAHMLRWTAAPARAAQ